MLRSEKPQFHLEFNTSIIIFSKVKQLTIHIDRPIAEQFIHSFEMTKNDGYYQTPEHRGTGTMKFIQFPSKLEFYHWSDCSENVAYEMTSINPSDSEWISLHINLADLKQLKLVGNNDIEFHKHLPIGVLIYGPGIEITTHFEPNQLVDVCSLRFPKAFTDFYLEDALSFEEKLSYEDLDFQMEEDLRCALSSMHNKMICHKHVLDFLIKLTGKLKRRKTEINKRNIHIDDVRSLFKAASMLRNPLLDRVPSVNELSHIAGMSSSKFKQLFKQLFGSSPIQFHHKIRMEYAKEALISKNKTPTQLSYEFGYSHPSNFTSAFKKYFDELPSSFV